MAMTTILSKATSTGESLRTIVPMGIVKNFELKEGDTLNWSLKVESGKIVVVLQPNKNNDKKR